MIETHSEHLILRILRRIRETGKGNPHNGRPITGDDVAVYFVNQDAGHTVVRRIDIDKNGDFVQPWPDDFFEIDFYERFGGCWLSSLCCPRFSMKLHPDIGSWKEQLHELGHGMFPRNVGCPVVVADLQDGNWSTFVVQLVQRLSDKNFRADVMRLLGQIKQVGVRRPGHLRQLVNHGDWQQEAILSHRLEAFDRIVTSAEQDQAPTTEMPRLWNLADVREDSFWTDISPHRWPPLDVAKQVACLRKLCLVSDFLCLVAPHIEEGGSENDFALALVKSALDRPTECRIPHISDPFLGPRATPGTTE